MSQLTILGLIKPWNVLKKVEARNFDIRKTLIKFDDVMNDQRQVIFSQRLSNILKKVEIGEMIDNFLEELFPNLLVLRKTTIPPMIKNLYIKYEKFYR